uniref:C-type lectin domain-containing protein n=1 Tax=Strongyloides venezuelensis TaxID=75913 RepID=A0A0K0FK98_STRVS
MNKILYHLIYFFYLSINLIYPSENILSTDEEKCSTNTSGLYLDVVFVIDISEDAAVYDIERQKGITFQFVATGNLSMNYKKLQSSRIALITASDETNVIGNFSAFNSLSDLANGLRYINSTVSNGKKLDIIKALNTAEEVIKESSRQEHYKKLVVLFSSHEDIYCELNNNIELNDIGNDICRRAAEFKNNGYNLMTIRLDYEGKDPLNKHGIASPCFSLDFDNSITRNMLNLALQANCFCQKKFYQVEDTANCMKTPECLYLEDIPASYVIAEEMAKDGNSSLVDIRSEAKQNFLLQLTNNTLPIFIGLNQISRNGTWKWDTGFTFNPSNDYNQFAVGEMDKEGMCASLGKDYKWYAVDCNDPSFSEAYVYQKRACDATNFCLDL